MNSDKMTDILQELKKPFHPSHVTWKPGMATKDQTKALALAYADLRAYQNRLDEICGMEWSVTYTPWGDRIVCHLTIDGITRSSSGEPDSQSERSEIAGTSAEAQAFKRACAMFGLGRYLYSLPSVWVEYDANTKQFTEKAKAKLEGIVVQHYRRTMIETEPPAQRLPSFATEPNAAASSSTETTSTEPSTTVEVDDAAPTEMVAAENDAKPQNGKAPETKAEEHVQKKNGNATHEGLEPLRQQFNTLGQELYGTQWEQVSRHNVERITGGKAVDSGALTTEQIQKLVDGMKKLQRKRYTTPMMYENAAVAA